MAVHIDITDGAAGQVTYDKRGQVAWEYTRIAVITGMLLPPGLEEDIITPAIEELIALVGDVGAPHPTRVTALLRDFQADAVSQSAVKIRMTYRDSTFGPPRIEVGASLSQVESNVDINGYPIVLRYKYPDDYKTNPARVVDGVGVTLEQGGMYTKLTPEASVKYQQLELESPLVKATQYVGSVNDAIFLGLGPRRWLCTQITGTSDDGGYIWDVTYVFQARVDTWDQTLVFINPDDGKPPADIDSGDSGGGLSEASAFIQVYPEANFSLLGLQEQEW